MAKLFPSAGTGDTFSDAQIQLAQEAEPLSLPLLVLIPKPSDKPSAPITLRSLGLPEIFYRLAGRVAVRIEGPLVGPTMEPLQLGVGIPFGCQIGAKGAQCAFDAREALLAVDLNNAFNTEKRQSTFQGVSAWVPRLLRYYMWRDVTDFAWTASGLERNEVKQGDLAGPLYFAVSTYSLLCHREGRHGVLSPPAFLYGGHGNLQ